MRVCVWGGGGGGQRKLSGYWRVFIRFGVVSVWRSVLPGFQSTPSHHFACVEFSSAQVNTFDSRQFSSVFCAMI